MNFQNKRAGMIKSSPSMAVSMLAKKMVSEGLDVIDLSLGEPDFDTPPHIIEAAHQAMLAGKTRYTAPNGVESLRKAIVAKFKRDNQIDYQLDEITLGNGAKQLIFNAFLSTLEEGDEVLVPTPYWVSYTDIAILHGGKPVLVECGIEDDFKITAEKLAAAITPKTRWLLLNSPSNPSGAIYTREEYVALGKVLENHPNVIVMSDEIYEHIITGDTPFVSFVSACPALKDRTLIINGVSKAYAMTGWRLGYAVGPKALIDCMNKMQSQSTTCPSSISQIASAAALDGPQDFVSMASKQFAIRSAEVTKALRAIPGLEVSDSKGAFYAFPKCAAFIGKKTPAGEVIQSDTDLSTYLLQVGLVATVPGSAFGLEGYVRLSTATSSEQLAKATARIADALAQLK
ncbi:pyridoxal phosphate-dependent aminotransferase [Leeia sp. TBRC 13508]|uniref:Aminotransferase n=1 Tax=Leeia speluncae TaxID=2884804 RepID=A0ABS8D8Y4_9NEIS|nr:pyridoxal phosphate-dependent aminotransferase [Leeia speluncae]MCB6184645.1 pyridoxal phosphate-dependent aminotransferase [Leeia speluncae]